LLEHQPKDWEFIQKNDWLRRMVVLYGGMSWLVKRLSLGGVCVELQNGGAGPLQITVSHSHLRSVWPVISVLSFR
jgi:hypothetical protein